MIMNSTLIESVTRANTSYEIRRDHETGLMFVYASDPGQSIELSAHKIGQTQTLQGARLIRRNHARKIERNY